MARRGPPSTDLILGLLLSVVAVSYLFIVTAGRWTSWPTYNTVYDLVAEGFRSGHLYTRLPVAPELAAAPNPLDPSLRQYWFWDASYYHGHIYYYWGPLPALLLAGIKSVLSLHQVIGDQYFVYWFYVIHLVAGAVLIVQMARRVFPGLPFGFVIAGLLVFAYGNPTPFIVATPGIYQAATIGGQAFLVSGLAFAGPAVWGDPARSPSYRHLLAAGLCWALGLATRISIAPAVVALILLTTALGCPRSPVGEGWRPRLRTLLWLSVPVGTVMVALLVYNRARFDSFFDFGMQKQMSIMQFRTSVSYIAPNLYSYLLRPMVTSCRFPFLTAPFHLEGAEFPAGYQMPAGYWVGEPVAGMLIATPWIWFVPLAAVLAGRSLWLWRLRRRSPPGAIALDDPQRVNFWFMGTTAIIATVPGLATVGQFIATMRYMVDVASGIILLGLWGAWSLYQGARDRPRTRRTIAAAIYAFSAVTVVIGLLLGMTGYGGIFEKYNPALYARMVGALSLCSGPGR